MKKIILSVFVFVLLLSATVFAAEVKTGTKNTNLPCVATAVSAREDSTIAAWNTLNSKIVAILSTRKTDLANAWALTDKTARKTAVKAAWDKAKTDRKAANAELKTAKKTAWTTFKTAVKACGGAVGTEASAEKDSTENIAI